MQLFQHFTGMAGHGREGNVPGWQPGKLLAPAVLVVLLSLDHAHHRRSVLIVSAVQDSGQVSDHPCNRWVSFPNRYNFQRSAFGDLIGICRTRSLTCRANIFARLDPVLLDHSGCRLHHHRCC